MAPDPSLVGQLLGETYQVEHLLGEGGMGAVYAASHARIQRRFAIKVLNVRRSGNPETVARFEREAMIGSRLGHDHIVQVLDFNHTADGFPYIVMELLEGEDLHALLRREGKLSLERAANILRQVGLALSAAHAEAVVHRDLKPENVYICNHSGGGEIAKVLDFGISKVLDSETIVTRHTTVIGTPNYMAPEQAEGRIADIDHRTDIFALGLILYQMLTGKMPFPGSNVPAVLYQVVHGEPPPLEKLRPDLHPGVLRVVEKAIRKRRSQRYQSVNALVDDLSRAMGSRWKDSLLLGLLPADRAELSRAGTRRGHGPGLPDMCMDPAGADGGAGAEQNRGERRSTEPRGPERPEGGAWTPGMDVTTTEPPARPGATAASPPPVPEGSPSGRRVQDLLSTDRESRSGREAGPVEPSSASGPSSGPDPGPGFALAETLVRPAGPVPPGGEQSASSPESTAGGSDEALLSTISRGTGEVSPTAAPAGRSRGPIRWKRVVPGLAVGACGLLLGLAMLVSRPEREPGPPASRADGASRARVLPAQAGEPRREGADRAGNGTASAREAATRPAEAREAVPDTRALDIVSVPAGAQVLIQGAVAGSTPISGYRVTRDALVVELRKPGYEVVTRKVEAGVTTAMLAVTLDPLPASLSVSALHDGMPVTADVFLDGRKVEQTPARIQDLEPGRYTLLLAAPGYTRRMQEITLRPGEQRQVVWELKKE